MRYKAEFEESGMRKTRLVSALALCFVFCLPCAKAGETADRQMAANNETKTGKAQDDKVPSVVAEKEKMRIDNAALMKKIIPHDPPAKIARKITKSLDEASKLYWQGKLDDAEEKVNQALAVDGQNRNAVEFKDKIRKIKERILWIKKDMAQEHNQNARRLYQEGNVLDAVLEVRKSLEFYPDSMETESLYLKICEASQNAIYLINERDRKKFIKAMKYFLAEDFAGAVKIFKELEFDGAVKIFRELQKDTPEMVDFLNAAVSHLSDERNRARAREYLFHAVKNVKEGKFKKTQEYLYLSLALDKDNLSARLLLEQVNEEMGELRASSLGGIHLGQ